MKKKVFYLKGIDGSINSVSPEVYKEFYRMKRRELYLQERDIKNHLFFYNSIESQELDANDLIADPDSLTPEDMFIRKEMSSAIKKAFAILPEKESAVIKEIYLMEKSERQISQETGIPKSSVNKIRLRGLKQMKQSLENYF